MEGSWIVGGRGRALRADMVLGAKPDSLPEGAKGRHWTLDHDAGAKGRSESRFHMGAYKGRGDPECMEGNHPCVKGWSSSQSATLSDAAGSDARKVRVGLVMPKPKANGRYGVIRARRKPKAARPLRLGWGLSGEDVALEAAWQRRLAGEEEEGRTKRKQRLSGGEDKHNDNQIIVTMIRYYYYYYYYY